VREESIPEMALPALPTTMEIVLHSFNWAGGLRYIPSGSCSSLLPPYPVLRATGSNGFFVFNHFFLTVCLLIQFSSLHSLCPLPLCNHLASLSPYVWPPRASEHFALPPTPPPSHSISTELASPY
jgi:hypothetical protein